MPTCSQVIYFNNCYFRFNYATNKIECTLLISEPKWFSLEELGGMIDG